MGRYEESRKNFQRALQILNQNLERRSNIPEDTIEQFCDSFIVDIFENYNEVNDIIDENISDYQEEIRVLSEENDVLKRKNKVLMQNHLHAVRIKKKR